MLMKNKSQIESVSVNLERVSFRSLKRFRAGFRAPVGEADPRTLFAKCWRSRQESESEKQLAEELALAVRLQDPAQADRISLDLAPNKEGAPRRRSQLSANELDCELVVGDRETLASKLKALREALSQLEGIQSYELLCVTHETRGRSNEILQKTWLYDKAQDALQPSTPSGGLSGGQRAPGDHAVLKLKALDLAKQIYHFVYQGPEGYLFVINLGPDEYVCVVPCDAPASPALQRKLDVSYRKIDLFDDLQHSVPEQEELGSQYDTLQLQNHWINKVSEPLRQADA